MSPDVHFGAFCGNSFALIDTRGEPWDNQHKSDVAKVLTQDYPIDSVLYLSNAGCAFGRLDIFEKDGSQSNMCGNGILFAAHVFNIYDDTLDTRSGAVNVERSDGQTSFSISDFCVKGDFEVSGTRMALVECGEPHLVMKANNASEIHLQLLGDQSQNLFQEGVNVDVIQTNEEDSFLIRTYERGVLRETQSCGTGSLSSYLFLVEKGYVLPDKHVSFISIGGSHCVGLERGVLQLSASNESFSYYGRLEDMHNRTDLRAGTADRDPGLRNFTLWDKNYTR